MVSGTEGTAVRSTGQVDVVSIDDDSVDELIEQAFGREPILIQCPTVFALFVPATVSGAHLLDTCKQRRPGKYYGVIVGDARAFFSLAKDELLARYLLEDPSDGRLNAFCKDMHSSFVRVRIAADSVHTTSVCKGRLQGLFFHGLLAQKMRLMEKLTAAMPDKLFEESFNEYAAPIGSSCNISGDPAGSITALDRALEFARARGVRLCLTSTDIRGQGSQPVFGLSGSSIETLREGPGTAMKTSLLQEWLKQAEEHR